MENEKKYTVLIAEDEDDLREMYTTALLTAGFRVLEAKNGEEVFEFLESQGSKIGLLLLDIVMPGMDGFEVLKKIKKGDRFGNIPIIVSTNLDNDEDKRQAEEFGVINYFVKSSHTPKELVGMIIEKCFPQMQQNQ